MTHAVETHLFVPRPVCARCGMTQREVGEHKVPCGYLVSTVVEKEASVVLFRREAGK